MGGNASVTAVASFDGSTNTKYRVKDLVNPFMKFFHNITIALAT